MTEEIRSEQMPADGWEEADAERRRSVQKQRALRQNTILSEAALLLNERGYGGMSLSLLADRLGISKQALYYYVKSKSELLYLCYQKSLSRAEEGYRYAEEGEYSGLERIARFVRHQVREHEYHVAAPIESSALSESHRQEIKSRMESVHSTLMKFIDDGISDGSIEKKNPHHVAIWIHGSLATMTKHYSPDQDGDVEDIASEFIEFMSMGLARRSS